MNWDGNFSGATEFVVTRCKTGTERHKFQIGGSPKNRSPCESSRLIIGQIRRKVHGAVHFALLLTRQGAKIWADRWD